MKYVPFAIIQAAQHYDPEATGLSGGILPGT